MPTRQPPLCYDVFTAPENPFTVPPPRVGDPPAWDPKTSTLIFGARHAVLADALMSVRQATALSDWVALHDRKLTAIYITATATIGSACRCCSTTSPAPAR
jgi:hypothetical protein